MRRTLPWLLAVSLVPALHAVALLGRIHPDEVYQLLEPAYHRAHGYGILAWEWQTAGLRNWAWPLFFSWLIRGAAALGITHPWAVRAVLEVPQWLLHLAALLAAARWARRRLPDDAQAAAAAALVGLQGLVVLFAGRTLGESLSVSFLVLATSALDGEGEGEGEGEGRAAVREGLLGGLYLGLAVVTRYGSAVMVLAALGYLAARRRWAVLGACMASGAAVALALGALDWATWGAPFHSLRAYLDFNVLTDQAAQRFGRAPAGFYLPWLLRELPAWAWPAAVLALRARPRGVPPLPLVLGAAYLVAISATPHKEERFLYPAVVLLSLAAAPVLVAWGWGSAHRWLLAVAAAAVALLPLAWDWPELRGDQFRALVQASRGDATGLLVVNEGVWGAGGYFYLGRRIPWTVCDEATDATFRSAMRDGRINRAVTFEGRALGELQAAGFRVTAQVGRETVLER